MIPAASTSAHYQEQAARLLAGAKRPLILAGRDTHLAGASPELPELADCLGALTAGTALAPNFLEGDGYLGAAGGFGTDTAAGLMGEALWSSWQGQA